MVLQWHDYDVLGSRSIVMSVSVCLSVGLHISKTTGPNFAKFSAHADCRRVAPSSSGGVAIRYVFPVL